MSKFHDVIDYMLDRADTVMRKNKFQSIIVACEAMGDARKVSYLFTTSDGRAGSAGVNVHDDMNIRKSVASAEKSMRQFIKSHDDA